MLFFRYFLDILSQLILWLNPSHWLIIILVKINSKIIVNLHFTDVERETRKVKIRSKVTQQVQNSPAASELSLGPPATCILQGESSCASDRLKSLNFAFLSCFLSKEAAEREGNTLPIRVEEINWPALSPLHLSPLLAHSTEWVKAVSTHRLSFKTQDKVYKLMLGYKGVSYGLQTCSFFPHSFSILTGS